MRCKQGDLAIITSSSAGNEGKIVQCVMYLGKIGVYLPGGVTEIDHAWEIDRDLPSWTPGNTTRIFHDSQLRPLRGDISMDESTTTKEIQLEMTR